MAQPVFSLKGISFSYGEGIEALEGLDLDIAQGERVALIGANGTGKSTLLSILDALAFPDGGTYEAFGEAITERAMRDVGRQRAFRKRVGFVFQNPDAQLFCPSVREDIAFGPLQLGVGREETLERVERVAARLRIERLLDRAPHQLSIGEKRKVAIAGVLAIGCDAILLDEPTAGLDPRTSGEIARILAEENAAGRTICLATHDLHLVAELARVVHAFGPHGRVERSGRAREILSDRPFLEAMNLMHPASRVPFIEE
jgi:cobalt/nickel transport system ATP-binding protein